MANQCWTTLDEIKFARGLFERAKVNEQNKDAAGLPGLTARQALMAYIRNCQNRVWYGNGMCVDPAPVILQATDWLAELKAA